MDEMPSKRRDMILQRVNRAMHSTSENRRWKAAIAVRELIEIYPAEAWEFVVKWGRSRCEDTRAAVACCVLEHLLEHHFLEYFPKVKSLANCSPCFAKTFMMCWKFGKAEEPANARAMDRLSRKLFEGKNRVKKRSFSHPD